MYIIAQSVSYTISKNFFQEYSVFLPIQEYSVFLPMLHTL